MLVLPAGDIVTDTVMIDGGVTITGIAGRTRLVSRAWKGHSQDHDRRACDNLRGFLWRARERKRGDGAGRTRPS